MNHQYKIVLTFDVEEFDLPLEYGQPITAADQMQIGNDGLTAITSLLQQHKIECTLFTTANFAIHFPEEIKALSQVHEIASHSYYHSSFEIADLLKSKQVLEQITGKAITGLRMPRMLAVDIKDVLQAGYQYDSSINPTYIPGRYNNLKLPRKMYVQENLLRVPVSVTPTIRFPLFWLSFKNLPYAVFKQMAIYTLKKDGYLSLYFHPWEFTDISHIKVPAYTKRHSGTVLLNRLHQLIVDLKNEGEFCSIQNLLAQQST
jgi:peptidoglycan/xylan/chitin deacetylase (PgdA/CDA1 family)